MINFTNNTVRPIWMGSAMLIPGSTAGVEDFWATHSRVMQLVADGALTQSVATRQTAPIPARPAASPPTPPTR